MGGNIKIAVVLITTILVISGLVVILYPEERRPIKDSIIIDDDYYKEDLDDDGNIPDDDGNGDTDQSHIVFIEEASDTGCIPCVNAAKMLHELYETGEYNFYYVSLVEDKSSVASRRMNEELHIFGVPVVYIDGGYKVLFGGSVPKSDYIANIKSARIRELPEIDIKLNAEYDENSTDLLTNIIATNNESQEYTGKIRVYLTEIISRWNQANSEPYHFALVDYIIEEDINIPANGNITVEDKRKISEFAVPDLLPEELFIIAVIFNSESTKRDSFPADPSKGEFDAYFAEATKATYIVPGGNLPPQAKILQPEKGKFYMWGNAVFSLSSKKTILTGSTKVVAEVNDDSGIEKVEFYIDGTLVTTDTEAPYEYQITKPIFGRITLNTKHTLKIIAYDIDGKTDDAVLEIYTLFRIKF